MPHEDAPPALHVAVVGAGAFGRNHLRVYREMEAAGLPVRLAALVETDPAVRAQAAAQYAVPAFPSLSDLLAARHRLPLHAASVCVPTSAHFHVAAQALAAGLDLLVEKPLAATVAQADDLIALAARHQRILQVGHLERFNAAVSAAAQRLHRPMFFEAHRLSIFTPRSLDVDVVLDLMIHDLDIVLSFARSPVREVRAVGLPVLSRKVDIANVRVEFDSGCIANFTASRVSTERVRKLRFFQPHQYVSIDYARQDLLVIDVGDAAPGAQAHPSAGLSIQKPDVAPGEPLRRELESFIETVQQRARPVVSGEDGRAALALALEINRAIHHHAQKAGLDRW
jgi:predicted dehydrogenase